jgi:dTDP-4-dehydrorhamnose 3,5-epimerase
MSGARQMPGDSAAGAAPRRIPNEAGLDLAYPDNEKGLGAIILSPESPHLIAGVRIEPFPVFPDDRGYFLEVQRMGRGLAADFPAETTQASAALNYPGTVKAFHYHTRQTDLWTPVKGTLQVALADLRRDSPTFGLRNTMYLGTLRPWRVRIPPGVAHGYKVVGTEESLLVYLTNRIYDPQDEGRIQFDDPGINYDWETQKK